MHTVNTISFKCKLVTYGSKKKYVEVMLVLDGELLPDGRTDVAGILFGGACSNVSFYVYTCLFCVPGCAGYHIPLEHRREGGLVTWDIEDEKLARDLGSARLVFDAVAFDGALEDLEAQLKKFEYKGWHAASFCEGGYRRGKEVRIGIAVDEFRAESLKYYQGMEAMRSIRAAAEVPGNPGYLRYFWDRSELEVADDPMRASRRSRSAVSIAASILNLGEYLSPSNEERAGRLAEIAEIIRTFGATGNLEEAQARIQPFGRYLEDDGFEIPEMRAFGVDAVGPYAVCPIF